MGLHDRKWYQDEMQTRAGRPVTIEQKMAASAAKHRPAKANQGKPGQNRANYGTRHQSQGMSPWVAAIITITVLAAITVGAVLYAKG